MDVPGGAATAEESDSGESDAPDPGEFPDRQVRLAALEAENRQLREEYARARQAAYRRTALGLFAVGLVGLVGGLAFPDARTVLFALGGTGVFAGVLTSVLTPERFVSARVGARVVQALRADRDAAIDELGLRGDPAYVPTDGSDRSGGVRLFVPRRADEPLPDPTDLTDLFVVPEADERGGVAFHPTGEPLFEDLDAAHDRSVDATPETTAAVAADALVELFELADSVAHDVDLETNRVTFEIEGAGLGDPTGFDHPIPSVLAVALVRTVDAPVRVDVTDDDPLTVTCRYDPQADAANGRSTATAEQEETQRRTESTAS
ncbi:hypothetical protein [Halorubrum sp. AJ67]|uniref:hypothetical protein n=1 Tax=Halorubrum sp. AJ67 TaxID=1173487 RepID=UPI0003DD803B|nr:hypothetical protein [Halorubrum sp. AJ67]CDK39398.1 uncharacterized protein BN903_172 [Halorubrum sp. AJ67]